MPVNNVNTSPSADVRQHARQATSVPGASHLNIDLNQVASDRVAKAIKGVQEKVNSLNDGKDLLLTWASSAANKKQDRRSRRTRTRLINALLELLGHKSINAITVTELTEMADVNRATFYSHYRDVHDMLDQLKADGSQMVYNVVSSHSDSIGRGDYGPLVADIVDYVDKNEGMIHAVLGPNGDGTFFNDIIEVLRRACAEAMTARGGEYAELLRKYPNQCNYHFYFISGGVMSIMKCWLDNGRPESVDEITATICTYVRSVPLSLLTENLPPDGDGARPGGDAHPSEHDGSQTFGGARRTQEETPALSAS